MGLRPPRVFLDVDQYRAVMEHLPDDLKPAIETAYITEWRVTSEILTRQKNRVNMEAAWLRLEPGETQNGEGRNFPLTPSLHEILAEQIDKTRALEQATGRIIPWLFYRNRNPIKDFRGAWARACKRAGVPKRIPHDFRRTAVRNLERVRLSRQTFR
jgi:integrase